MLINNTILRSIISYVLNEANKQHRNVDLFHVFHFSLCFLMLFCRLFLSNVPFTASNGVEIILYEMGRLLTKFDTLIFRAILLIITFTILNLSKNLNDTTHTSRFAYFIGLDTIHRTCCRKPNRPTNYLLSNQK